MLRRGLGLAAAIVLVSLAASLIFGFATLFSRPLDNTEGCLLFEASRIRAGLPLYTDPIQGAFDYGTVPARYHVLYPPLWALSLSLAPASAAAAIGRFVSLLAWFGVLAWIGWGAFRRGRPLGAAAAAFFGAVFTLALYGASARPDALAVAVAAVVLERTVRSRGNLSASMAGLLALVAFLKPNVVGIAAGLGLNLLWAPRRLLRPALGAASVTVAALALFFRASHGAFLLHLAQSTLQRWSLSVWIEQISTRPQFFALPIVFALATGLARFEDEAVRVATLALGTSLAWTLASLGKMGSATCYWMEPALATCVLLAHVRPPALPTRWHAALAVTVVLQALCMGVASVRSSVEAIGTSRQRAVVLLNLRRDLSPGSLLLSDDAGLEFALDGRLIDTPFQTTELIRAGHFPRRVWMNDILAPAIVGVVTSDDILERPLSEVDPFHDRYDPETRVALRDEFILASREAGLYVYRRR